MKSSNNLSKKLFGTLFAAALGLLSITVAHGQIILPASDPTLQAQTPTSGSQTYDIDGTINYNIGTVFLGDFLTEVQTGEGEYISGYTGFFGNIPVYSYYPIYSDLVTDEYSTTELQSVSVTNAYNANGTELALSYVGPNLSGATGSGSTGLVPLVEVTLNPSTPDGLYSFSASNSTGSANISLNTYTYDYYEGYYNYTYNSYDSTLFSTSFSIDVAPEPSTWVMLLGGLGLLAFWRVRTRRAQV